jgi:nitrite reductase/ring-hydroxylating ferredoxin subunit
VNVQPSGQQRGTIVTKEALSRRNALAGAATVGIGLPLLAACSGDSDETATDSPSAGGSASGSPSEEASAGTALGAAADVPVGGGVVFKDEKVVVTQPAKGEFKGFSAICTHQGCPVGSVADGVIMCPCHGSAFSIEDGSVEAGPATKPLGAVEVKVKGGEITLA